MIKKLTIKKLMVTKSMNSTSQVYAEVLKRVGPTRQECANFKKISVLFLKKLNSQLEKTKTGAKAILGGSGAKDTWLSGNHDIDVFVVFDYKRYASRSAELSDILSKILKKTFSSQKIQRLHGSRDYFQLQFKKFQFEVVPILKVTKASKALNITDISPLHARWVNQHEKKLKDEIRLAKQFCKAHSLYGAESYIGGFSGYVLEILIIFYGSFEKLLKSAQQWAVKDVIDAAGHYPKKDAFFHINQSKMQSPLIVIDPVDKERNAAAALSLGKFILFKKEAKEFLEKRSILSFEKKEINWQLLKEEAERKKQNLAFMMVVPHEGKRDVVGAELLKAYSFLVKELAPFSVSSSGWAWQDANSAFFYFFLEKKELPQVIIREGPLLKMKEFVADFKRKNKDTFEKDGKIAAYVPFKHPLLHDFVKEIMNKDYFQEKVAHVKSVAFV